MSKAVLISICPKWVEKILSGEKTLELKKTRPKLETPFKCYIYCTKDEKDSDRLWVLREQIRKEYDGLAAVCAHLIAQPDLHSVGNGYVVGEFVCDRITNLSGEQLLDVTADEISGSCLSTYQAISYLAGNGGYGWHISNLKIYDKPLELDWFRKPFICHRGAQREECIGCWECEIKRPPQSWCYVEELE